MSRRTGSTPHLAAGHRPARALAAVQAAVQAVLLAGLLGLAAAPATAAAALAVRAGVDRTELAQDEVVTLEVRVEADEAPSVALPTSGFDFLVVSQGRSTSTSVDLGGGGGVRIRRVFVFQYALSPQRAGDLVIPAIEVTAGQATGATQPITVKVTPPGTGGGSPGRNPGAGTGRGGGLIDPFGFDPPGGGSRAWSGWERELALSVELDKKEVFVGEQLTVSVYLLSPADVVSYEGYRPPSYDGFWNEPVEQPSQIQFTLRKVDGAPLRAYLLERVALFPTRAGDLELGSYGVDAVIQLSPPSPFSPFPEKRRARRESKAITLHVKPLPPGAPAGFDAANVASAALTATLSQRSVAVGQPVTLKLTAAGEGNVKSWALPALPRLPGLRAFAPTTGDKVAAKGTRVAGQRAVETVLVPLAEGTVTIPPIAWPVFDPRKGAYEIHRTAELTLEVASPAPAAGPGAPVAQPGQNPLAAGLRPIRPAGPLSRGGGEPPWGGALLWLLLGAPVALFAVLTAVDRVRERRAAGGAWAGARRLRQAGRVARRRLAEATRLAAGAEAGPFFAEVERALVGYCDDKLGRAAGGLTRDELARALADAGAHAPALRALATALDACDAGRYGGDAARDEVLAHASRAMEILEEAHWHAPQQTRRGGR